MTNEELDKIAELAACRAVMIKSADNDEDVKDVQPTTAGSYVLPYGRMIRWGTAGLTLGSLANILADVLKDRDISTKRAISSGVLGMLLGAGVPLGMSAVRYSPLAAYGPNYPYWLRSSDRPMGRPPEGRWEDWSKEDLFAAEEAKDVWKKWREIYMKENKAVRAFPLIRNILQLFAIGHPGSSTEKRILK